MPRTPSLDPLSVTAMNSLPLSSPRNPEPAESRQKSSCSWQRNLQPCITSSMKEKRSSPLRAGAPCDGGRPNNWQDFSAWPESPISKAPKNTAQPDRSCDKWTRQMDGRCPRDKSKTNNIMDSARAASPVTAAVPKGIQLASAKQRAPVKKTLRTDAAAATSDGHAVRRSNSPKPRFADEECGPVDSDNKVAMNLCSWAELSDLLPPSKVSFDQMDGNEIVSQVMKIRDSLRSASLLTVALKKQPNSEMKQLQLDYLDAIIEILKKQEACYLIALEKSLVGDEKNEEPPSPKSEEHAELEMSESSNDDMADNPDGAVGEIPLNNQRPMIEEHLGHYSDEELEELQQKLKMLNELAVWSDAMTLPKETLHSSSPPPRSPRTTFFDETSSRKQKYPCDRPVDRPVSVDESGLDRPSRMPPKAMKMPAPSLGGKGLPPARNKSRGSAAEGRDRDDDVDYGLDCQELMMASGEFDMEALEDLSLLVKKRHELEMILEERSEQLKELKQHHDMLKELLKQQEEAEEREAQVEIMEIQKTFPSQGVDGTDASAANVRSQPRQAFAKPKMKVGILEDNLRGVLPESVTKEAVKQTGAAAAAASQAIALCDAMQVERLSNKDVRKETKRSVRHRENGRTSAEQDDVVMTSAKRPELLRDRTGLSSLHSALKSDPDQSGASMDFERALRQINIQDIGLVDDVAALESAELTSRRPDKKYKQFEIKEECAESIDDDNDDDNGYDPNSSLALRDEPQHLESQNKEKFSFSCGSDVAMLRAEDLPQEETSIKKLQQNMSKLVEAKKELETLRSLLHCGAVRSQQTEASRAAAAASGDDDLTNSRSRTSQKQMAPSAGASRNGHADELETMQRIRLLKVANEKLDKLRLVMDDMQTSRGFPHTLSSPSFPLSNLTNDSCTAKASNTSRTTNLTSRIVHLSGHSSLDHSRSQEDLDACMDQMQSSDLDHVLQLVSDEKSARDNCKSTGSSGNVVRHASIKDSVFIRNSLPESVSSHGTSRPVSGSAELISGFAAEGGGKIASKNSSVTNVSKASCVPCISRSADRMQVDSSYRGSNVQLREKNSQKPCKIIRNHHDETAKGQLHCVFRRCQGSNNFTETARNLRKGVNLGKKNIAVNTENGVHEEPNENRRTRAELKNITQELRLLHQEVSSLKRTICRSMNSPSHPSVESRSVLDPQLLVGLNQSFQQLLADNRRLSNRFNQLHDFVMRRTTNLRDDPCNISADSDMFDGNNHKPAFVINKCNPSRATRESSDSCPKQTTFGGVVNCGRSRDVCASARVLARPESNSKHRQSPKRRMRLDVCGNVEDCFGNNSNGNNSEFVVSRNPETTFQSSENCRKCDPGVCQNFSSACSLDSEMFASSLPNRFDAVKEQIYSEVALFISKHENRPHYLLDLVRQLQSFNTDALRHQAVGAIDQLLSGFLTDETSPKTVMGQVPLCASSVPGGGDMRGMFGSWVMKSYVPPVVTAAKTSKQEDEKEYKEEAAGYDTSHVEEAIGWKTLEYETSDGVEDTNNSGHSSEGSGSGCVTDFDKMENEEMMEAKAEGRAVEEERKVAPAEGSDRSDEDEVNYLPDFKSSSSGQDDGEEDGAECDEEEQKYEEAATANCLDTSVLDRSAGAPEQCRIFDGMVDHMGFITVEFVEPSSACAGANTEDEKGSPASDESWEKAEIPKEQDGCPQWSGSGSSSSEIAEDIVIEDDGSEIVEETTLDQLHAKLTSISKEEIERQMAAECQGDLTTSQILEMINEINPDELAGRPDAAKQPVSSPFDDNGARHV